VFQVANYFSLFFAMYPAHHEIVKREAPGEITGKSLQYSFRRNEIHDAGLLKNNGNNGNFSAKVFLKQF
jgi:hypothetical protein